MGKKNINKLKCKRVKRTFKKTLLGLTLGTTLISLAPNIKYFITLQKSKENSYIEETLDSNKSREEQVALIFSYAIDNNPNISYFDKIKIKEVFIEKVINEFGSYFTDDTIYNMYAVASTEKVQEMFSFSKNHGWWNGHYNSYNNVYSLETPIKDIDKETLAHEQLHGILKSGLFSNGFVTGIGLWKGLGADEGTTTLLTAGSMYSTEQKIMNQLGLIIGYDHSLSYYLDSDLDGLKKELYNYLSKEDVTELFNNLDFNVLSIYLQDFFINNSIEYDKVKIDSEINYRNIRNEIILMKIFENKYKENGNKNNLRKLIFSDFNMINKDSNYIYDKYYVCWSLGPSKNNEITISIEINNSGNFEEPYILWSTKYTFSKQELESIDINNLIKKTVYDDSNILFEGTTPQKYYRLK